MRHSPATAALRPNAVRAEESKNTYAVASLEKHIERRTTNQNRCRINLAFTGVLAPMAARKFWQAVFFPKEECSGEASQREQFNGCINEIKN